MVHGYIITPGADLRGADLSNADLVYANLRCADLRRAYLVYANLTGADLTDALLTGADFSVAWFRETKFTADQLMWMTLSGQITPVQAACCNVLKTQEKPMVDTDQTVCYT
jgi:uncharacterized protein YjbI with pentapeptide repeats